MRGFNRKYEGDFARSIRQYPDRPVVISEGDSWFDYPFYRNVVTWLDDPKDTADPDQQTAWNLMRLEHSGDEVVSMISGGQRDEMRKILAEYPVQAILFSGGGNDIVGPNLLPLLKPYQANNTAEDCLDQDKLNRRIRQIQDAYMDLLDLVVEAGAEVDDIRPLL